MKTNTKPKSIYNHEGTKSPHISKELQLRRAVLSCMLFEKTFYEDGEDIAIRISILAEEIAEKEPEIVAKLAIEARHIFNLRHAPLLLLLALVKKVGGKFTAKYIAAVISRADEITELVALYWRDGRKSLPRSMRRGLNLAFEKFDEYQFAKYNRNTSVKFRDVLRLTHPQPKTSDKDLIFRKITKGDLKPPNTWESRLTRGEDKKAVFEDLLKTRKLGYMALLRNLRGMTAARVDEDLIREALAKPSHNILPFRFISAARHAPQFERELDQALEQTLKHQKPLIGKTIVLVDVSYSMQVRISSRSEVTRLHAASALAAIISGICKTCRIFTFSNAFVEVPPRRGIALTEAIWRSQEHSGTDLGSSIQIINENYICDRLIVITDEQTQTVVPNPKRSNVGKPYIINVAPYANGIGYGPWVHIDGFSENTINFIQEYEKEF